MSAEFKTHEYVDKLLLGFRFRFMGISSRSYFTLVSSPEGVLILKGNDATFSNINEKTLPSSCAAIFFVLLSRLKERIKTPYPKDISDPSV